MSRIWSASHVNVFHVDKCTFLTTFQAFHVRHRFHLLVISSNMAIPVYAWSFNFSLRIQNSKNRKIRTCNNFAEYCGLDDFVSSDCYLVWTSDSEGTWTHRSRRQRYSQLGTMVGSLDNSPSFICQCVIWNFSSQRRISIVCICSSAVLQFGYHSSWMNLRCCKRPSKASRTHLICSRDWSIDRPTK